MTTTLQTTDRRGFLRLVAVGGLGWLALQSLGTLEGALPQALPQVRTDNPHAALKHGLQDVLTVRSAMIDMASREPDWFNRPPCKDGRYRFVLRIGKLFGVWVLVKTGQTFQEVTAFLARQDYAKAVDDACGGGGWRGHSYG